ncbi:hypothetical protein DCC39_18055 [Pueribacillus theae]|uniref:Uncharacterized protein n=1 Tax=Pueribacillus theae TaxID=2171751 RepID=A0A2U1JJZ6_9BACI|nr:hypothetical protein [Pueribacillus theae]PWA05490.1 hypothetical protein DCC39_18055 [Pueribacillus theae]
MIKIKDGFKPVRRFKKVGCIEINSGILEFGTYDKRFNGFMQAPVTPGTWIVYAETQEGKMASILITHNDINLDEVDLFEFEENNRVNVGGIDEREGFNVELTKQIKKVKEKKTTLFTVKDSGSKNSFKLVTPTGLFPVHVRWIETRDEVDVLFIDFYGYY